MIQELLRGESLWRVVVESLGMQSAELFFSLLISKARAYVWHLGIRSCLTSPAYQHLEANKGKVSCCELLIAIEMTGLSTCRHSRWKYALCSYTETCLLGYACSCSQERTCRVSVHDSIAHAQTYHKLPSFILHFVFKHPLYHHISNIHMKNTQINSRV